MLRRWFALKTIKSAWVTQLQVEILLDIRKRLEWIILCMIVSVFHRLRNRQVSKKWDLRYVNMLRFLTKIMNDNESDVIYCPSVEDVKRNAVFKNKELLVTDLALFAIHYRFQFKVYKSDKNGYVLKCLDDNYKWGLRASIIVRTTNFKMRDIKNSHTCSLDAALGDYRQAMCSLIASCIKYRYVSTRIVYTPADIVRDMMKTNGVSISYEKAWRACECALEIIRGDPEVLFGRLPTYLHILKQKNPGPFTKIEKDDANRFLFAFVT
ncbi:Uncharacterized protein Adt_15576 [Abeliophyllum distichum]|uniref:Uncharacterized protein n=1 Tax=Abeliophyllum distichum TaxID=126358 RepID=A0ABD1U2V4_9LAMI